MEALTFWEGDDVRFSRVRGDVACSGRRYGIASLLVATMGRHAGTVPQQGYY